MKRVILSLVFINVFIIFSQSQINHQPELVPGTNENNIYYPINNKYLSGIEVENTYHYLVGDYVIFSIKGKSYTILISLYPKYRPEIDGPGFTQKFGSQLESEYKNNKTISSYMFNRGIIKRKISNIDYIDSIVLSAFSSDDIQFTRRVITSFENYFLIVDIKLNADVVSSIFAKTPEYFFMQNGIKTWNYKNKAEESALDDIYRRKNIDANKWYDQTTTVISSIKFSFRK
jgi:hypothetical protein